ncbi:MAG: hypothetical protein JHD35_03240 [Sphingopyxis sp.]|nr:hypothetical protein [Sphingopyxis sp.]
MSKVAVLSAVLMRSWADFARDGNPGFGSWSADSKPLIHFDNESWVENPDGQLGSGDSMKRSVA